MQNDVKKLSELIMSYLDKVGLFEQSKVLEVYSSWASIVGEKQAAHSKLLDIKHQTAVIEVDHPGWSQQILLNKKYILRNFQKKYPQLEVKNISVIVSSYYETSHQFGNIENNDRTVPDKQKASEKTAALSIQQKISLETDNAIKTELPQEVQKAFERLRMSISERD
ncbi:DUF721 domain-containing protein [Treponema sp. OMZ 305]|nr:DUF721 domain-containing protein [Treponema sp. OMZ 305]